MSNCISHHSETQGQHFGYQQGMTNQRSAYGNGQGQGGSLGGSAAPLMAGSNISNSDLSNPHQYQLMRNDVSAPMRGDSLQYDSQSFPSLSNGNSNGSGNRFSASSMQQIREDDFTMQNEDFPALPGSLHGDRNTQKLDDRGFSMGMVGGGMSGLGNSLSLQNDRLRESSQDSLQQQLVLQQQQHLLLQQQMRMGNQNQIQSQGQGQGQGHSFGPTISRGVSQHSVAVGGGDRQGLSQGGNNSLSGGAFSGLGAGALTGGIGGGTGVGGMGMGMGMGMLSLGQGSASNANGVSSSVTNPNGNGTLSSAALNLSGEGRFGLPGLLDVIRMTDKVCHSD